MDSDPRTYEDGYQQGYEDGYGEGYTACEEENAAAFGKEVEETVASMLEEHGHRMKAIGLPRLIAGLIKQPGSYWESVITAALSGNEGAAYQLATRIEAMEKAR
jgi:hypothetical protein